MRRSSAPSQVTSLKKRPRFSCPFKETICTKKLEACNDDPVNSNENAETSSNRMDSSMLGAGCSSKFRTPLTTNYNLKRSIIPCSNSEGTTSDIKVYSVVWRKLSKKKHKRWDGDAVLIYNGRSAILKDMEGIVISKHSGYKTSDLANLEGGSTLILGDKEIEITDVISFADYNSGRCFQNAAPMQQSIPQTDNEQSSVVQKQFSIPALKKEAVTPNVLSAKIPVSQVKPRHDPSLPGALVMPQPDEKHQELNNKNCLPVVDVVVDPYLSCHLRPHQKEGVTFLYECVTGMRDYTGCGAILADAMGLGKTLQCITLIWTLFKQGPYNGKPLLRRILIVTPSSLVKNWCNEFRKWLGNERIRVYPVTQDHRPEEFARSPIYPVLVISYEMFAKCFNDIKKVKFDIVICDEGHRLKNTNIKITSLIKSLNIFRRIVLTGTPIQNDLQEFYSLCDFCNPGVLGLCVTFKKFWENPILLSKQPEASKEHVEFGKARENDLARLAQMFVLRRTQSVNNAYLPSKVEMVIFCQPSSFQVKVYEAILHSQLLKQYLDDYNTADGRVHLACIATLKKLCNHPQLIWKSAQKTERQRSSEEDNNELCLFDDILSLFSGEHVSLAEHSGKLLVLSSLLYSFHATNKNVEKSVVVSNYTETLDILQEVCVKSNYRYLRLDGTTPSSRRQELVDQFNNRNASETVFLLSCKAGGQGLNLIGASRLILYDIDWNPANDLQAMARVWRDGQKRTVHIYRLLTVGTIEEKIYQRQVMKQGLSSAIVDASSCSSTVTFSQEELKDLFTLVKSETCATHDLLNCVCDQLCGAISSSKIDSMVPMNEKAIHLSMDQLMEWEHYKGPIQNCVLQGSHLQAVGNAVSFVFSYKVNKPTT